MHGHPSREMVVVREETSTAVITALNLKKKSDYIKGKRSLERGLESDCSPEKKTKVSNQTTSLHLVQGEEEKTKLWLGNLTSETSLKLLMKKTIEPILQECSLRCPSRLCSDRN